MRPTRVVFASFIRRHYAAFDDMASLLVGGLATLCRRPWESIETSRDVLSWCPRLRSVRFRSPLDFEGRVDLPQALRPRNVSKILALPQMVRFPFDGIDEPFSDVVDSMGDADVI